MKIKAIVTGAAIVAAGVIGVSAGTASAGCAITLELHNPAAYGVTIDWHESDVQITSNPWKRLGSGTSYVAPGDTRLVAYTADWGCWWARNYRLYVESGSNSWWADHGPTTDTQPHIHVD